MKLQYQPDLGWGNLVIHLSDYLSRATALGKTPYVGQAFKYINHDVFPIKTEEDADEYVADIFINPMTIRHVHPLMRTFIVKPPGFDATKRYPIGLHIRRGKYGTDSQSIGVGDASFHCDDRALAHFVGIIERSNTDIFLASDSLELKNELTARFPGKISTIDVDEVVVTDEENKGKADSSYRDWFTLSQCEAVFCTAGDAHMRGFSTFGYTAGIFGKSSLFFVSSEGVSLIQ